MEGKKKALAKREHTYCAFVIASMKILILKACLPIVKRERVFNNKVKVTIGINLWNSLHLKGIFSKKLLVNCSTNLFYKQAEPIMKNVMWYICASYIKIVPKDCVLVVLRWEVKHSEVRKYLNYILAASDTTNKEPVALSRSMLAAPGFFRKFDLKF